MPMVTAVPVCGRGRVQLQAELPTCNSVFALVGVPMCAHVTLFRERPRHTPHPGSAQRPPCSQSGCEGALVPPSGVPGALPMAEPRASPILGPVE